MKSQVAALEARGAGRWWHPAVCAYMESDPPRTRYLVACSGGADSVALLFTACLCVQTAKLVVAHYNHGWRGAEADGDADFVERLAAALGCEYLVGRCPPGREARSETAARAQRLDFLRAAAADRGASALLFGHQRGDILETQLLRLARGSGSEGLAAPRPVHRFWERPDHLRPLLEVPAETIRRELAACGVHWREDRSNADNGISRNALRSTIIPALRGAVDRDIEQGAARSRALLEEDAAALKALAAEAVNRLCPSGAALDREGLKQLPRGIARRVLRQWLRDRADTDGSAKAFELLLECALGSAHGRSSLGSGQVVVGADRIDFEPDDPGGIELGTRLLTLGTTLDLGPGRRIGAERISLCAADLRRILAGEVDPDRQAYLSLPEDDGAALTIRKWQRGDRYQPLGASGRRKLSDCFNDRGIDRMERRLRPVVLNAADEILWMPGLLPAHSHRLEAGSKAALKLTYNAEEPTLRQNATEERQRQ